jgi:chromosome segregation ATPase
MDHGPAGRCLTTLTAGLLLALSAASEGLAGEWETLRESYDNALRTHEKRIGEIESKERGIADQERRAEKITRDRVSSVRVSLKGGGKGKSLADAAEKATDDPKALADLSREQGEHLDVVQNEWATEGPEQKKLREAMAAVQKNFERVNANLTKAAKATEGLKPSDVLEKAAAIEAMVTEAGDRLKARWQLEQAARERETKQREREAAERARGTR